MTVNDDETHSFEIIAVSNTYTPVTSLTISEGQEIEDVFCVILTSQPSGAVSIALTSDSGRLTFDPATVTKRGTASTTCVGSRVDVTATENAIYEGEVTDQIRFSVTTAPGDPEYLNLPDKLITVFISDNDQSVTYSRNTTSRAVIQEGNSFPYTIVLDSAPVGGNVTITGVLTEVPSDFRVTGLPAIFHTVNWNTPQTVTVTAIDDEIDDGNNNLTITHTVDGADYGSVGDHVVRFRSMDNDTKGITVSPTSLTFGEFTGNSYSVVLDSEPTADVTITINNGGTSDITVSESSLTFTPENWSRTQGVGVTAVNDGIDENDETFTITHSVSNTGGYGGETASSVSVTVEDDDTAGLRVTPLSRSVTEGNSVTFEVQLTSQPAGNVPVAISDTDTDDDDLMFSRSAFTFNPSSWNNPKTVTVTAIDDDIDDDESFDIRFNPGGGDYNSVSDVIATVIVTDDDYRGVTVTALGTLNVVEGGSNTYTIVLRSEPSATTTLTVMTDDVDGRVTVDPSTWDFTIRTGIYQRRSPSTPRMTISTRCPASTS